MICEVLDKYLENKKKVLLSYAEVISKVYEIDKNILETKNISELLNEIFKIYISKYYIYDYVTLQKLNDKNLSDRDFKMTLALSVIADYFGSNYENVKEKFGKSIYNLTLIVYVSTNIDKEITSYNSRGIVVKGIRNKLESLYEDVLGKGKLDNEPFLLDILASKIKDSERMEIRFFESLKSNESYNRFLKLEDNIYYVDYVSDRKNLYVFDEKDVKYVYKEYDFYNMFLPICYDLVNINILKLLSNNCFIPKFILPINIKFLEDKNSYIILINTFKKDFVKKHIVFGVDVLEYVKNESKFMSLKKLGFDLALIGNVKGDFDYKIYDISNKKDYLSEDELVSLRIMKEN